MHAQGVSPIPLDPFAGATSDPAPSPRRGAPRLVVALLYDQLRGDLLDTFAPAFGDGGFRRLERDGARFTDCTLPYAITLTAIKQLRWLSFHAEATRKTHYLYFEVPKRSGGKRLLSAPHALLKATQRKLLDDVLSKIPLEAEAHGFVKGHSTVTNARRTWGRAWCSTST